MDPSSSWKESELYAANYDKIELNRPETFRSIYGNAMAANNDDDNDDYPIIPDIEELENEDFMQQTAVAPEPVDYLRQKLDELSTATAVTDRISVADAVSVTVRVRKPTIPGTENMKNIAMLFECFLPEDGVKENDVAWTWDSLMADVMNKLKDQELFSE